MDTYLKLHATQLKQLTQTQTPPLHDLNARSNPPRNMKATIFHNNEHTNIIISKPEIETVECRENIKNIHITIASKYLSSKKTTKLLTTPYSNHSLEQILPRHMRTKLSQFRANKLPLMKSYVHIINHKTYMQQCPLC